MSTIKVRVSGEDREVEYLPGETVLEALRGAGLIADAPCGGLGVCGKCAVTLVTDYGDFERVLACQTHCEDVIGDTIVPPEGGEGGDIMSSGAMGGAGRGLSGYAAAVDLGTTTLAARIIDRSTGEELAHSAAWNGQLPYGADVISRIKYASTPEGLETLERKIRNQVGGLMMDACAVAGIANEEVEAVMLAGNTTMEHIFAGVSPESIGRAPYRPATRFDDGGSGFIEPFPYADISLAPCVSGFVGGDTVAALYAAGEPSRGGVRLLLDIGTNGEMALARDGRLTACSAACGPAFEGAELTSGMRSGPGAVCRVAWDGRAFSYETVSGEARGICGSGIVDLMAALVASGAVDGSGLLLTGGEAPEAVRAYISEDENGLGVFTLAPGVVFTAADVRKLQLAKAAVRAGIEILLSHSGLAPEDVDEVLLAGGFGTRIDPASAEAIGMLPAGFAAKARGIGNAALDGAQKALCEPGGFDDLLYIRNLCEYIELSGEPDFSGAFVDAMSFGD